MVLTLKLGWEAAQGGFDSRRPWRSAARGLAGRALDAKQGGPGRFGKRRALRRWNGCDSVERCLGACDDRGQFWMRGRGLPQLRHRVSEEADGALAGGPFFAELGAVAGGMEPALKDAVGKGAGVSAAALALAEFWARDALVRENAGVSTASLLPCTHCERGTVIAGVSESPACKVIQIRRFSKRMEAAYKPTWVKIRAVSPVMHFSKIWASIDLQNGERKGIVRV